VPFGTGTPVVFPEGLMTRPRAVPVGTHGRSPDEKLDDDDYPAYSMGRAAEILGVAPAFLRSLDTAGLIAPQRSGGGHRRYSRYQLRLAGRAHELIGHGTPLDAACRIIILEDQLAEAQRINAELQGTGGPARPTPS
jgi:hypothetical protein